MDFSSFQLPGNELFVMMMRFLLNTAVLTIIIRFLYYPSSKKATHIFTYYLIGIIIFFLCYTLKSFELDIGIALGLFAIFGIIRYRTDPIDIKEMTYLFTVIGLSVINALAKSGPVYPELLLTNGIVILVILIIERMKFTSTERSMNMVYEKIENINFEDDTAFLADLRERLGIEVTNYEIKRIDYLRDTAELKIYYVDPKEIDGADN